MARTLFLGFMWSTIALAIVLPVVFRSKQWLRVLSVVVLIWWATTAWVGILTNARVACEDERRGRGVVTDDFDRGARAARDASYKMTPLFWAVVIELSLLTVVPSRTSK